MDDPELTAFLEGLGPGGKIVAATLASSHKYERLAYRRGLTLGLLCGVVLTALTMAGLALR